MIKNGRYLLSVSNILKFWDTSNWNEITTIETGHSYGVKSNVYFYFILNLIFRFGVVLIFHLKITISTTIKENTKRREQYKMWKNKNNNITKSNNIILPYRNKRKIN